MRTSLPLTALVLTSVLTLAACGGDDADNARDAVSTAQQAAQQAGDQIRDAAGRGGRRVDTDEREALERLSEEARRSNLRPIDSNQLTAEVTIWKNQKP